MYKKFEKFNQELDKLYTNACLEKEEFMEIKIENLKQELEDMKFNANVCLKRETNIIKEFEKSLNKVRNLKTTSNKLENIDEFSKILNYISEYEMYKRIGEDDERLCEVYTSWLEPAYSKQFGKDYDGSYQYQINLNELTNKLMNKKLVEKKIYTNLILSKSNANPYSFNYENNNACYYYHPTYVEILADSNFDENKKYTIEELKKLQNDKKIIIKSNLLVDEKNKVKQTELFNLNLCKYDFKINNVEYKEKDNVKTINVNNSNFKNEKILNLSNINYYLSHCYLDNCSCKDDLAKYSLLYENFFDHLKTQIIEDLNNEIKQKKLSAVFIQSYYKYSIKKFLSGIRKDIAKLTKKLNVIETDNDIYEIDGETLIK